MYAKVAVSNLVLNDFFFYTLFPAQPSSSVVFPKHRSQSLLFWLSLVRFQFVSNWSQVLNRMEYLPTQLLWPWPQGQTQSHPVHGHRLPVLGFFPQQGGEREEVGRERSGGVADLGKCFGLPLVLQRSATNGSACSKSYTWSGSTAIVPGRLYVLLGTGLAQHTRKEQ